MANGKKTRKELNKLRRMEVASLINAGDLPGALRRSWSPVLTELKALWRDRPGDAPAIHRAAIGLLLDLAANLWRYNPGHGSLASALVHAEQERGPETLNRVPSPERPWTQ